MLLVLVMLLAAVAFVLLTLKTPVTSVTLSETSTIELPIGQTKTLTYSVSPYDADCDTVTWTSSNTSVATVSDGKITAKGKGTCTITVTVNEGKDDQHTASVSVKVGKAVKEIELSVGTVELKVGEEHTITYEITPSDAMTGVVSWESSDETVATVKNGKIEAKKLGTCTITFTAGGKSATATVKVVTLYSEETQIVGTWKGYAYLEGDETVPLSSGTTYLYLYSDGTGRMTISGTTPLDFVWEYTEYEDGSYFYDVTYTSFSGTTQMMSFELSSGKDCVAFKLGSMIVVYTK